MELLDKAYNISSKYKQHKAFKNYTEGFKDYYKEVFKLLPSGDVVLDVGTAYGIMPLYSSLQGKKTYACDMTDEYTNKKMLKDNNIEFFKMQHREKRYTDKS